MIVLSLKLVLAHVLGDFVFQPNTWVADKECNTYRSKYLYLHGLIHLITLLLTLTFDWTYWFAIICIVISHLLIDLFKLTLSKKFKRSTSLLFVLDQALHLLVIGIVVNLYTPYKIPLKQLYTPENILLILAILFLTSVSTILMKIIMSRFSMEEDKTEDSLKNAGQFIGILERLFVFAFILLNQWSAIGLLIAAKSVFRFGDLSRAKDRKLTEYILIGTLLSFGLAIATGLAYKYGHALI